jgi:hypothetical protein
VTRKVSDEELHENLVAAFRETKGYIQKNAEGEGKHTWVLGDLREKKEDRAWLVFGRLGKLRPGSEQKGYDWQARAFIMAPVDQETATGWSNFVIDLRSRVILYEDRPPHVSGGQFRAYFKKVYEIRTRDYQDVEIFQISPTDEIYAFISSLDRLTRVSADVGPANPEATKEFEALQRQLQQAKATEAKIVLSNPEGLVTNKTLASEAIALAAVGYGTVTLSGSRDNETFTLHSKSKVVREVVGKAPDDPDTLIGLLGTKLKSVLRRLGKK